MLLDKSSKTGVNLTIEADLDFKEIMKELQLLDRLQQG